MFPLENGTPGFHVKGLDESSSLAVGQCPVEHHVAAPRSLWQEQQDLNSDDESHIQTSEISWESKFCGSDF